MLDEAKIRRRLRAIRKMVHKVASLPDENLQYWNAYAKGLEWVIEDY